MKKIARICAVLLTMCVIASLFAGCGEKSVNGDITEITMWSNNTASKETFAEIIEYYNENYGKKDGVKVVVEVKEGSSMTQNIELALQTGDAPDFFNAGDIAKLSEAGNILAIEDMPGTEDKLAQYADKVIEKRSGYNGKTYRLPLSSTPQGLVYNKDMFRAAGLVDENGEPTPPKTFAQMREYAKKLTNADKKQFGMILPIKWGGWFGSDIYDPMLGSVGHKGYDPVTGKYDYSGLVPIMETYIGMKADGSIYPGAEGLDNDPARAAFAAGNVGMKMAYSFDISVYTEQFTAEIDWGVAPYPVVNENDTYMQRFDYGLGFFVNSAAVERVGMDKLMSVWNFINSDEYVRMLYERGVSIPSDYDIVKDVKLKVEKKGWEEFTKLVDISHAEPLAPSYDSTGMIALKDRFINDVWTGKVSPKDMLEQYAKDMENATIKYYQVHTEESADNFLNPDWNIKR